MNTLLLTACALLILSTATSTSISTRSSNSSNTSGNANASSSSRLQHHHKHHDNSDDEAGVFDLYVLSMSYQPEFCYQNKYEDYYYCEQPRDTWRYNLTIHGLWPEYTDGGYPSTCSNEEFDEHVVYEIGIGTFEMYWVNVKVKAGEDGYTDFWEHEWSKHGTCSGLNQTTYFSETIEHSVDTPSVVSENYGGTVSKDELVDAYGGPTMVATVCESGKYLSEIRVCVGMESETGMPLDRIECPQHVLDEDNCESEITFAKFYVDEETKESEIGSKTGFLRGQVESEISIL